MNPGWYAHIEDQSVVAYFDGARWRPVISRSLLTPSQSDAVELLAPGHSGPPAPFEHRNIPKSAPSAPETIHASQEDGSPRETPERTPQARPKARKNPAVIVLAVLGSMLGLIGVIIGSVPVNDRCGSPFSPDSDVAALMDTLSGSPGGFEASCMRDIDQAAVWTWLLIVVGIAMILVAIIVASIGKASSASQPSVAALSGGAQIEELARLRDNGLISEEEFEAKKAEILARI